MKEVALGLLTNLIFHVFITTMSAPAAAVAGGGVLYNLWGGNPYRWLRPQSPRLAARLHSLTPHHLEYDRPTAAFRPTARGRAALLELSTRPPPQLTKRPLFFTPLRKTSSEIRSSTWHRYPR